MRWGWEEDCRQRSGAGGHDHGLVRTWTRPTERVEAEKGARTGNSFGKVASGRTSIWKAQDRVRKVWDSETVTFRGVAVIAFVKTE